MRQKRTPARQRQTTVRQERTPEEVRKIQLYQLEMLCEVDRICRKRHIPYSVIAGTLLGAVRHGGFIPWDDDADVAFLRPQYEAFREAVRTELDTSRFYFQEIRDTPGYRWGYGKLRRKGTAFVREHQEHMPYEQGVFIDLFPLDAVPENRVLRTVKNAECFLVRKLLWARVGREAEQDPRKRLLYRILDKLPQGFVFAWYGSLVKRASRTRSRWVRILTFPTPNRQYGYLKRWYLQGADTVFEGRHFRGIRDADGYLRFKFGNYWELPPESERKQHPVSLLKL